MLLSQMCVSDTSVSTEEEQPARRGDAASAASARRGAAWGVGSPSSSSPSPWPDPPSRGEGKGEGERGGRTGAGERSWSLVELPSDVLLKLVAFFRPTDTFMASQVPNRVALFLSIQQPTFDTAALELSSLPALFFVYFPLLLLSLAKQIPARTCKHPSILPRDVFPPCCRFQLLFSYFSCADVQGVEKTPGRCS
jgi:hypothetical protein